MKTNINAIIRCAIFGRILEAPLHNINLLLFPHKYYTTLCVFCKQLSGLLYVNTATFFTDKIREKATVIASLRSNPFYSSYLAHKKIQPVGKTNQLNFEREQNISLTLPEGVWHRHRGLPISSLLLFSYYTTFFWCFRQTKDGDNKKRHVAATV